MFLPLWLFYDLGHILSSSLWYSEQGDQLTVNVLFLLIVDGVLHWLQNILAFTLLKLVAPLTYAVANVTKRVAIISVSLLLLQNQVQILKLLLDHKIVCVTFENGAK
jgi:solute carrier family 35 protein E1